LLAVDDLDLAFVIHHADIAGAEEAVARHHLGRLLRPLPVAWHHLRPAGADLAGLPERHVIVAIADRDFGGGYGQTDSPGPHCAVAARAGQHRRTFRQSVALE